MNNKKALWSVLLVSLIILVLVIVKISLKDGYVVNDDNILSNTGIGTSVSTTSTDIKSAIVTPVVNKFPIVSSIKNSIGGTTSSILSWKTDVNATTELYYSKYPLSTKDAQKFVVRDFTPRTAHTIEITHLDPATRYYFSIVSINPDDNAKSTVEGELVTFKP